MKNKIYTLTLAVMFFSAGRISAQCSTTVGGTICDSTKSFTNRGLLYAHYDWQSKVIPQTGYNYVNVYDSANGSLYDMMVLEMYTCGTNDLQLNISPGYAMSVVKYNLNNQNCGGSANNEHVIIYGKGSNIAVYIMKNNCGATTDTVTFWYRKLASYPSNADGFGNQNAGAGQWIGEVYKWNNANYYYNNLGTTGNRPVNFTLDTGTVVPVINGCQVCPTAATTDSFTARFKMDSLVPRGFYKITCNTSNDMKVSCGSGGQASLLDYWTNGSSSSSKTVTQLLIPNGTNNYNPYTGSCLHDGNWTYELKKATGNFKADITICKLDGDYTWGNNVWNAYVFDGNGTSFNNYIGQFGSSTPYIGYNWTSGQPNVNTSTCNQSMDDSLYKVHFLMKYNFAAGNYKFRIRSYKGGQSMLTDRKGVVTAYLVNNDMTHNYDVTTAYNYLSGDTFLMIKVYEQGGTKSISYNHCRQPKDVGHITTSGGTVTGDSVCNGNTVTLTADTTDGTETQWWKGVTCGTGTLIGTGASINVTPDSSTTFYARNRNYCVNSNDTLNKIDLFSNSCTSRRLTLVSKPGAPTAPSAQTSCNNGSQTYTFSNVTAGSGGNQIEWATNSNFTSSTIASSPATINVTVSAGTVTTVYIRSRISATGCVSSAVTTTATNNALPLGKTVLVSDTLIIRDSSLNFIVLNSQTGIRYDLRVANTVVSTKHGNGDTIAISTGAVDTNAYFNLLATDTNTGCTKLIKDSAHVSVYMSASILNTVFQSFFSQSDPNYYEIVDSIEKIQEILEEAEEHGITVWDDEGFEEMYEEWKFYWQYKIGKNASNPGSMQPAYKALKQIDLSQYGDCTEYNSWQFEGPDVDPIDNFWCNNISTMPCNTDDQNRHQNHAYISKVWVNPSNTSNIIVAIPSTGLWRTNNSGTNWFNISRGADDISPMMKFGTGTFAVQTNSNHEPKNIYVSTVIDAPGVWGNLFTGIYYTTDAGQIWVEDESIDDIINQLIQNNTENYNSISNGKILKMEFSPDGVYLYAMGFQHIFRKNLSQNTWLDITPVGIWSSCDNFSFDDIEFVPNHPERIFVGSSDFDKDGQRCADLFYSEDAGINWSVLSGAFNGTTTFGRTSKVALSIPTDGSDEIYALVISHYDANFNMGDIYINQNNLTDIHNHANHTAPWTYKGSNINTGGVGFGVLGTDIIVSNSHFINPFNSNDPANGNRIIYLPREEVWCTYNYGGVLFDAFLTGYENCHKHADIRSFVLLESDLTQNSNGINDLIYLGTDGGVSEHPKGCCAAIFQSNATGEGCISNMNGKGLTGNSITDFDIDENIPTYFVYSAIHHWMTEKNGNDWTTFGCGDTYQANVIYLTGQRTLLWSAGGGSGTSNLTFDNSCPNYSNQNSMQQGVRVNDQYFNRSLAHKPVKIFNGKIYLGTHGLMYSAPQTGNTALTFNSVSTCTSATHPLLSYDHVFFPNATTLPSDWDERAIQYTDNLHAAGIQAFDVNEQNEQVIYLAFQGPLWKNHLGLIKSVDGGCTWSNLTLVPEISNIQENIANGHGGYCSCSDFGCECDKPFNIYPISDVKSSSNNSDIVWLSFGGFPIDDDGTFRSNKYRVMRSCTGGNTWVDVSDGLPPVPVYKLLTTKFDDNLVFAATSLGVFMHKENSSNSCEGQWECLNSGMPPTVVLDLEFDYCKMKLYAGTANWGIWSWDLPDELIQKIKLELSSNTTWNTSRKQYQSVVIHPGVTLTITGSGTEIDMARGTTITVETGGKLIVDDGATITNACGSMWGGIIVEGNPFDADQNIDNSGMSNQGYVYMNNANIENAYEALRVWNPFLTNGSLGSGGIVQAYNSHFTNNRRSAEFIRYHRISNTPPYNELPNRSIFSKCIFTTNDNHSSEHPFSTHVTAWDVMGLQFLGCTFQNEHTITPNVTNDYELGSGIFTIDAGIIVDDNIDGYIQNGTVATQSSFKNLQHGVYVANAIENYPVRVIDAKFENCLRGIRNEGVSSATFAGNEFKMGGNPAQITPINGIIQFPTDEGITLHGNMNGFTVEQNKFLLADGVTSPAHATIGIRSDGTGENNNRIYNNEFTEMMIGNLGNRQNRFDDDLLQQYSGLVYECNQNASNPYYDFAVTEPDMSDPQYLLTGIKRDQGSLNLGAGDEFSTFTSGEGNFGDYTQKTVNYYYKTITLPAFHTPNVYPQPFSADENTCDNNFSFPPLQSGCTNCLTFSGYSSAFSSHKVSAANYQQQYFALIDGGNTNARMKMADTITDKSSMIDSLMYYAPNLSSAVLDIVSKKNGLLGDTAQYEILKANAEGVNYEILHYLETRTEMPQWMLDSISAARSNFTLRSYLSDTLHFHLAERDYAAQGALRTIVEDTAGFDLGLYRNWLDSTDNKWAKREMVNTYLHEGKYDTIETLLANLDSVFNTITSDSISFKNYKDFVLAYKGWLQNDSSIMRLDSAHLQELKDIAALNEHSKGSQTARQLLNFFYDSAYFTPPMLPDIQYNKKDNEESAKISAPLDIGAKEETEKPSIKLYPNPAQNTVTIEYNYVAENSKLFVSDAMGILYEIKILSAGNGKLILNTGNYQNGIYLARVETEGNNLLKSKFIILR